MLVTFSPIFVADTKNNFCFQFRRSFNVKDVKRETNDVNNKKTVYTKR